MTAREVVQVRKEALQVQPLLAILARFGIRKGKRWRQPIFLMHTYTNVPAFFRIIVPWYQCTHTTSNATCATHVACTIAQLYPIKTSPYKTRMITPRCLKHATPVCFMRKIIEQCNFCVSSFMILIWTTTKPNTTYSPCLYTSCKTLCTGLLLGNFPC